MTNEAERHHCARCGMSFRLERATGDAERSRCPECKLAFWHVTTGRVPGRVLVGVDPREVAA